MKSGKKHGSMAAKRPKELKGAIILVKHEQVRMEIAVIQAGLHLEEGPTS